MNRSIAYFLLLTFYLAASCTEDYRLRTMEQTSILTVEGCITDEEGPYMVKLTENLSYMAGDTLSVYQSLVLDAKVIITDDTGNRDELKPVWKEKVVGKKFFGYLTHDNDSVFFTHYYLLLPRYDGSKDSLHSNDYKGYYYTTSITGIPGRTYTLTVEHGGKTYTATDRMPSGAALDSVVMRPVGLDGDGKSGDGFHVPYLYFPEPQDQENYYLFAYSLADSVYNPYSRKPALLASPPLYQVFYQYNHGITWGFVVATDRFMSPYMANYKLGDGPTSYNFYSATDVGWMNGLEKGYVDIYKVSVSKPVYRYFDALTGQFYQDGGAFSPAPVSPPTNVSNGGQGVFMAVSVAAHRSNYYNNYREFIPYPGEKE